MKDSQYKKLFLIYVYTHLGESNTKMFDELVRHEAKFEWEFNKHTEQENNEFLTKWKKENNIKLTEWYCMDQGNSKGKFDENGLPIIVERKN